ncbi:MAG: HEPN domain-containing protein [Spirochaetales bacterium]|nr:HEPN domain-containing protein [Spirochaetales bacterium]
MKVASGLRVAFYICLIFALICTMPWFRSSTLIFAIFTAFCAVESLFLPAVKNRFLRLLLALVPPAVTFATSFSWAKANPVAAVLLALVALYYVTFMTVGRFETEYWRFRNSFIGLISAACFVSLLCLIIYIVMEDVAKERINLPGILGFTITCALLGMIIMSEMRKGNPDAKWRSMNAGRILILFASAAAALALLYLILSFVFSLITPTLGPHARDLRSERIRFQNDYNIGYSPTAVPGGQMVEDEESMKDNAPLTELEKEKDTSFHWEFVAIGVIVCGAAVFFICRYMKKKKAKPSEEVVAKTPEEQAQLDKVEAIRAIFRQYILLVRKGGVQLTKGSTSADILESAKELSEEDRKNLSDEETKLRDIYIRARYGDPQNITDEDVSEARSLFEKITESNNLS